MSGKSSSNDARAAAFNPQVRAPPCHTVLVCAVSDILVDLFCCLPRLQHGAYNPTSQNAGSAMADRSQASMDARAASSNPSHAAYNPNTAGKSGGGGKGGGGKK
jgi:hypothetical protein